MLLKKALLIGNDVFDLYQNEPQKQLKASTHNVTRIGELLEINGFQVTRVVDQPALEVLSHIDDFYKGSPPEGEVVSPDSILLLYISSHGMLNKDQDLHILAKDTRLHRAKIIGSVEMSDILACYDDNRFQKANFVVILDCCFSDRIYEIIRQKYEAIRQKHDIKLLVIASSQGESFDYDIEDEQETEEYRKAGTDRPFYSIFSRYLIQALEERKSLDTLYSFIHKSIHEKHKGLVSPPKKLVMKEYYYRSIKLGALDNKLGALDKLYLTSPPIAHKEEAPVTDTAFLNKIREHYLHWLRKTHGTLKVYGTSHYPEIYIDNLEIFTPLRAYTSDDDIHYSRTPQALRGSDDDPEDYTGYHVRSNHINQEEKDYQVLDSNEVSVNEFVLQSNKCLILGDPGSGKTTLARWLVNDYVYRWIEQNEPLLVPILVAIADYAQEYTKTREKGDKLTLLQYLEKLSWKRLPVTDENNIIIAGEDLFKVFRHALENRQAVVVLDGLDEGGKYRDELVREIEDFAHLFIPDHSGSNSGNRLLVTSRVIGYDAAPLRLNLKRARVEPMPISSQQRFAEQWKQALDKARERDEINTAVWIENLFLIIQNDATISEMAGNPLLMGLFCSIYYTEKTVPSVKAELYHKMVESFATIRGILSAPEMKKAFGPIAYYIHEQSADNLIDRTDLEKLLKGDNSVPDLINYDAGLLTERAPRIYSFLHLTFQEYLAGLQLMKNRQLIVDKSVSARWREPIYFAISAISIDFSKNDFRDFFQYYIHHNNNQRLDIPLHTLITIDSLRGTNIDVFKDQAGLLVNSLLESYTRVYHDPSKAKIRQLIEEGFIELHRILPDATTDAIKDILTSVDPPRDLLMAGASILLNTRIEPGVIVTYFRKYLSSDRKEWGFAIHSLIQQALSTTTPWYMAPSPVWDEKEERKRNRSEYLQRKENFRIARRAYDQEQIREQVAAETKSQFLYSTDIRSALEDTDIRDRLLDNSCLLRLLAALCGGYDNKNHLLKEREYHELAYFLQRSYSERQSIINANKDYFIGRFGFNDTIRQCEIHLNRYQKPLLLRNDLNILEASTKKKNNLYEMLCEIEVVDSNSMVIRKDKQARLEDENLVWQVKKEDKESEEDWSARNIKAHRTAYAFRSSPYSGPIIELIKQKVRHNEEAREALKPTFSPETLLKDSTLHAYFIEWLWNDNPDQVSREGILESLKAAAGIDPIEKLIARLLLGDDIRDEVTEIRTGNPDLFDQLINKLEGIRLLLADAMSRVGVFEEIELNYFSRWDITTWYVVVNSLVQTIGRVIQNPVSLAPFMAILGRVEPQLSSILEADRCICALLSDNEDITYQFAVVLDTLPKGKDLLDALMNYYLAPNVQLAEHISTYRWHTDPLPYTYDNELLPFEVYEVIDSLSGFNRLTGSRNSLKTGFRYQCSENLSSLYGQAEDYGIEALLFHIYVGSEESVRLLKKDYYDYNEATRNWLSEKIQNIENPYMRARVYYRYALITDQSDRLLIVKEGLEIAGNINNVHQRARITERLIRLLPAAERTEEIMEEFMKDIGRVENPNDQARLLLRANSLLPAPGSPAMIRIAIGNASCINDDFKKIALLTLIKPYLTDHEKLKAEFNNCLLSISNPLYRALFSNQVAAKIMYNEEKLFSDTGRQHNQQWAPLLITMAITEFLDNFNESPQMESLWEKLANSESERDFNDTADVLLSRAGENMITLTFRIAKTLETIVGKPGNPVPLLSLLDSPTESAIPIVESWRNSPVEILKQLAIICRVEQTSMIDLESVQVLLDILDSENELFRLRASLIFSGGMDRVTITKRPYRSSQLTDAVIEKIVKSYLSTTNASKKRTLWLFFYLMIHDTPAYLQKWARMADSPGLGQKVGKFILQSIAEVNEECWIELKKLCQKSNPVIQEALTESLSWLGYPENEQQFKPQDAYDVFRELVSNADLKNTYVGETWRICKILDDFASTLNDSTEFDPSGSGIISQLNLLVFTARDCIGNPPLLPIHTIAESMTNWNGSRLRNITIQVDGQDIKMEKYLDDIFTKFNKKAEEGQTRNPFMDVLLRLTDHMLNRDMNHGSEIATALLDLTSYFTAKRSLYFEQYCRLNPAFIDKILYVIRFQSGIVKQSAALRLVRHLPEIDERVVDALKAGILFDSTIVRNIAEESINMLLPEKLDDNLLNMLIRNLEFSNDNVIYSNIRILTRLVRKGCFPSEKSSAILNAFSELSSQPNSKRGIYVLEGSGTYIEPNRIVLLTRFDRMLYENMLQILNL